MSRIATYLSFVRFSHTVFALPFALTGALLAARATVHGWPTLRQIAWIIVAMVAADLGKLDWAYKYFLTTAKIDLEAEYKVYVGTIFMGGSHPAANGGAWMTAVFGFGGVQATPQQIVINPRLYRKWRKLEFKLVHRGDQFEIRITKSSVAITAKGSNKSKHKFVVAGKAQVAAPGASLTLKY